MKEQNIINYVYKTFNRHEKQINKPFESDCELIQIGNDIWGFNIDEYNPKEDFFSSFNPHTLGYNLVIATISDLLASGVNPELYLHSCTLPKEESEQFIKSFFDGINEALNITKTFLLGGDTSFSGFS